jgi:hypothetical protein
MNEDRFVHDKDPGKDELALRLEAYASARLEPRPAATARIRTALIEEARMRALEETIGSRPHRHAAGPRRLVALLLAAGLTLATAVAVSAASAPGGPLYGARIWLETATLPADASARALERVGQIEERLLDAERAAESGDVNAIAAAIQAYREAVADALAEVGTDADRLARLEAALGLHVAVLEALADKVPAAAADGISRALEASQKAVDKIEHTPKGPPATGPAVEATPKPGKTPGPGATERPDRTPRGGPPASP